MAYQQSKNNFPFWIATRQGIVLADQLIALQSDLTMNINLGWNESKDRSARWRWWFQVTPCLALAFIEIVWLGFSQHSRPRYRVYQQEKPIGVHKTLEAAQHNGLQSIGGMNAVAEMRARYDNAMGANTITPGPGFSRINGILPLRHWLELTGRLDG